MIESQGSLFDIPTPKDAAESQEIGIDIVEAYAHEKFLEIAHRAGLYLAEKNAPFTSGDIRDLVAKYYPRVCTRDDRALGAVMRRLVRSGVIVATGRYIKSDRHRNHNRPMREWAGTRDMA